MPFSKEERLSVIQTLKAIFEKINDGDEGAMLDAYKLVEDWAINREPDKEEIEMILQITKKLRNKVSAKVKKGNCDDYNLLLEIANNTYWLESPYLFDSYMLYLESRRQPKERFYLPRRERLMAVVQALQSLVDDDLDEIFLSMPPRVGKTTIIMFFITWIIGKNSELSNLYCAYSDTITSAFYSGVLEIITDYTTYRWREVFPNARIASTNAKEETLNIDRKKRYPSLTSRSLYGTLNGACDCSGFLVADDLIGGIEEALNPDRLVSAWNKVDNNMLPRAKQHTKIIWIGTRWSLADPIGVRCELVVNDPKYIDVRHKIINLPALNKYDESNFDYKYGVGFDTSYYQKRRASFERNNNMADWFAQYQGEPIERTGALFVPEDMRYFNGVLPEGKPDTILMPCDVAWGGGDNVSAPVLVKYGKALYCPAVIFDPNDKHITQPRVVNLAINYNVDRIQVEKNNGGGEYKEDIERMLMLKEKRVNITSKSAPTHEGKMQRIFNKAPEIREIYFLEEGKRDKDYSLFMQNLFSFKIMGKNKNDDAPDSLAMGIDMVHDTGGTYSVFERIF